jgi:hypothetical protein
MSYISNRECYETDKKVLCAYLYTYQTINSHRAIHDPLFRRRTLKLLLKYIWLVVSRSVSVSNVSSNGNEICIARFMCCLLTTLSVRIIIDYGLLRSVYLHSFISTQIGHKPSFLKQALFMPSLNVVWQSFWCHHVTLECMFLMISLVFYSYMFWIRNAS